MFVCCVALGFIRRMRHSQLQNTEILASLCFPTLFFGAHKTLFLDSSRAPMFYGYHRCSLFSRNARRGYRENAAKFFTVLADALELFIVFSDHLSCPFLFTFFRFRSCEYVGEKVMVASIKTSQVSPKVVKLFTVLAEALELFTVFQITSRDLLFHVSQESFVRTHQ